MLRLAGLFALLFLVAPAAWACGPETDCPVGDRHYRIYLPPGLPDGAPAIVFSHGYKGSAKGAMKNARFRALADGLGAALIAVESLRVDWLIPGVPIETTADGEAVLAYFDAVRADAVNRFKLDPDRILATGFSSGGMMTWFLACNRPRDYLGFVPISGTFWDPIPETCAHPPASIIHIHGTADKIVPLTGRRIETARQGDLVAALTMYAETGGFGPPTETRRGGLACTERRAINGAHLDLCLHQGGHRFRLSDLGDAAERLGLVAPD